MCCPECPLVCELALLPGLYIAEIHVLVGERTQELQHPAL